MAQGIYWLLTIPHNEFTPFLPPTISYIRGQLERGADTGYLHWQLLIISTKKCRLAAIKKLLGPRVHAELSKSSAANDYVWKEETRVEGTQFELGSIPLSRARPADWVAIRDSAKRGRLDDIPAGISIT